MTVLNTVRKAVQKRAAFKRLEHEIRTMSLHTALDLGIFREDATKIASKAIYG